MLSPSPISISQGSHHQWCLWRRAGWCLKRQSHLERLTRRAASKGALKRVLFRSPTPGPHSISPSVVSCISVRSILIGCYITHVKPVSFLHLTSLYLRRGLSRFHSLRARHVFPVFLRLEHSLVPFSFFFCWTIANHVHYQLPRLALLSRSSSRTSHSKTSNKKPFSPRPFSTFSRNSLLG